MPVSFSISLAPISLREETRKSEPNSAFASTAIPRSTLAFKEWIAVSAAIPETIASEKTTRRSRCERLSRHAIRQTQG